MQVIDELLCEGPAIFEGVIYPMAVSGPAASAADTTDPTTATGVQATVGLVATPGAPANTDGQDGLWGLGADGHIYFRTGGAWTLKL